MIPPFGYSHDEICDPASLAAWIIDRANSTHERKVVFLVGSPLTEPAHGSPFGVANVVRMVDLVLRKIESRRPADAAELRHKRIHEVLDGELYQRAMSKLAEVFDESAVNDVVRAGVLNSTAPGQYSDEQIRSLVSDVSSLRRLEQQPMLWSLRPGVEALGRLMAANLPGIAPLVLTSNFDPLIEVAIRKHGGTPETVKFDRDGDLNIIDLNSTHIKVIHFHGWWLEGHTLHTAPMLTTSRPALEEAMRRLLDQFVIVPIAYGGWRDVFTMTLQGAGASSRSIDVRWGVFPLNKAEVRGSCGHLLSQYAPNQVRFYRGIDCHSFFPGLVEQLITRPPTTTVVVSAASRALPLPNTDVSSSIDWEAVRVLRRAVEARSPGSSGTGDDWSFLETKLGVLRRDAEQRIALTRDAVLLIGTVEALRGLLTRPIVDLILPTQAPTTDPTVRWAGREFIEKNLVWARQILLERFADAFRTEVADGRVEGATSGVVGEKPSYIAFREAAINLLVHQDYENETTKAVIELSSESWFFENPGCPTDDVTALVTPTPLAYRNPLINRAFRDAGWTENGKTGLRAINAAWSRLRRAPPKFTLLPNENRFRVEFSFAERAPTRTIAWIAELGLSPSHYQHDFLELLPSRTRHNKAEFQLAMGLPTQEFEAVMSWAVLQGILQGSPLIQGEIIPTESFAERMPSANTPLPPDVPILADNAKDIGDLSDKTIKVLTHCAEGITTVPRLQEVTGEARPTIRARLQDLQALGLVKVQMDGRPHEWTLTESGQQIARALAR